MATVVNIIGYGGQQFAEKYLGWNRNVIRKGREEIDNEKEFVSQYHLCGRKKAEYHNPDLLLCIKKVVEPTGQTDPTFRSTRIYTPLTAKEIRTRLITQHGYSSNDLPCVRTFRTKLHGLGYHPQKVQKCKPLKKIPETDAIFDEVHRANTEATDSEDCLRISLDTKATVKIGELARGGKSRQPQKAADHDFETSTALTPFGMLLPESGNSHLWFSEGKVTADFMVDRIDEMIPKWMKKKAFSELFINADNGPENSGRRTQWLKRLVGVADKHQITIKLAYYPPYHSKYNPVERLWGILENHWRGELLESVEKTLGLARTMTYKGIHPTVSKVTRRYKNGITVAKAAMQKVEARLERKDSLEPWFITITPDLNFG